MRYSVHRFCPLLVILSFWFKCDTQIRTGIISSEGKDIGSAPPRGNRSRSKDKKEVVGHGHGPTPKKNVRRRSLAQFEDVNSAIASCGVTVTESIDLGNMRDSDASKDGTESGTVSTSRSDDFDFDMAIEKQV
jgi:hypothetical protein